MKTNIGITVQPTAAAAVSLPALPTSFSARRRYLMTKKAVIKAKAMPRIEMSTSTSYQR